MNKLMKFLTPFIALAAMFLFVSPAQAEPTIPPSKECVDLMQDALDEIQEDVFNPSRKAFEPLVNAGCLNKNPLDEPFAKMPRAECLALAGQASSYLAPANRVARRVAGQMNAATKKLAKQSRAENKRLYQAQKKGNKAAVKKIKKRLQTLQKKYAVILKRVVSRNQADINKYQASSLLVYLDMSTRGCEPGYKWEDKNPGISLFAFSYFI